MSDESHESSTLLKSQKTSEAARTNSSNEQQLSSGKEQQQPNSNEQQQQPATVVKNVGGVLALFMLAAFFLSFNETLLSVANNQVMADWKLDLQTVQWTMTAFIAAMAISVPISAFIVRRTSTRTLFLTSLALVVVGLVVDAISWNFDVLIAGRVLEGFAGGLIPTMLFSVALKITKPARHGLITALCGVMMGLGPSFAPLFAGIMLDRGFNWHVLFIVPAVCVAILFLVALAVVPDVSEHRGAKVDWLSAVLGSVGFLIFIFGINMLGSALTAWQSWVTFVVGLVLLVFAGRRQFWLESKDAQAKGYKPIIALSLLKSTPMVSGIVLLMLLMIVNIDLTSVFPMAMQQGLKLTATANSLLMMVPLVLSQLFAVWAGHLFDRIGATVTVVGGLALVSLGYLLFAIVGKNATLALMFIGALLAFCGVAFANPTIEARMYSLVPAESVPDVSSAIQTSMQVAGSLSGTIAMALYANALAKFSAHPAPADNLSAFASHSLVLAIVFLLGIIVAWLMVREPRQEA